MVSVRICDKCGERIAPTRLATLVTIEQEEVGNPIRKELCEGCDRALRVWIGMEGPIAPPTQSLPDFSSDAGGILPVIDEAMTRLASLRQVTLDLNKVDTDARRTRIVEE